MGYREMLSSRLSRMLGRNVRLIFVFTGQCPTADRFFILRSYCNMFANETKSSYTELSANESRILVLHSGQVEDPIQCHLEHFSLDDPPYYEAVSYTWGLDRGENKTPLNNSNTYVLPSEDDLDIDPNSTTPYPFPYDPNYGDGEYVTWDSGIGKYGQLQHSSRLANDSSLPINNPFNFTRDSSTSVYDDFSPISYETLASSKKGKSHRTWYYNQLLEDFALNRRIRPTRSPARKPTLDGSVIDPSMLRGSITLGESIFVVRKNFELALHHLRQKDRDRKLWVDAVCIDQRNEKERGHQVARMSKIFQCAKTVCVWLGPAAEHSDDAVEFVKRLWHMKKSMAGARTTADCEWRLFKETFLSYGYPWDHEFTQLRALGFLMKRAWFYRRWVVQEVAFAADIVVQCGHAVVGWKEFTFAISFLHAHHEKLIQVLRMYNMWEFRYLVPNEQGTVPDIQAEAAARFLFVTKDILRKDELNRFTSLVDIEALVVKFSDLQVSDGRDSVYALLSLANDTDGSDQLSPDYAKSSTEVCVDFVRHVLHSRKSLDIICRHWAPLPKDIKLPSWIMSIKPARDSDVSLQHSSRAGESFIEHSGSWYRASNQKPAYAQVISHSPSTHILQAKGCVTGTISIGSEDCAVDGVIPLHWRCVLDGLKYSDSYSRFSDFWHVFVGGRTVDGQCPPSTFGSICRYLFQQHYTGLINVPKILEFFQGKSSELLSMPKGLLADITQYEDAFDFFQRLQACCCGRRLVATSDRMGLVPSSAKRGDLVCVLLGCNVPVILRRMDNSKEEYLFIGEAYFQGIMDGEALEQVDAGKLSLRDFVLV